MLLRCVLVKHLKKCINKTLHFVDPAEFTSANKEAVLSDSLTVSVYKQTLSSRPGFLADQF